MKAKDLNASLSPTKQKTARDLGRVIKNRNDNNPNYCFLMGSGASRSSGIKTGGELIEEWRSETFNELCTEGKAVTTPAQQAEWLKNHQAQWYSPLSEYSCLFEYKYPLPKQRRQFVEREVSDKQPSIGYAYLVRMTETGLVRTHFTTNFDDLLNEAFYQFSSERPLVCAHDSSVNSITVTSGRPKIIKLHGDYLCDDIKCTTLETSNLEKNMAEKLGEFLKEYGLIICGYSGHDKSIMKNLEKLLEDSNYLNNGLYWCFRANDEINDDVHTLLKL